MKYLNFLKVLFVESVAKALEVIEKEERGKNSLEKQDSERSIDSI